MSRFFIFLFFIGLFFSCTSSKNSPEFIAEAKGRYLFNSNETIEVFFEDAVLKVFWRDQKMTPIKANDSSFYLKEMNEKLIFVSKPEMHIELAEKREHDGKKFYFSKLEESEKTPLEYFKNKEYDKALAAYLLIQKKDSLDFSINQRVLNSLGYEYLRKNKTTEAKELFKINIALYPNKSNVYDSMGDAYLKENDTLKAIEFYKKALAINPENFSSIRQLKKLSKK